MLRRIALSLALLAVPAVPALAQSVRLAGPAPQRLEASPLSIADGIARRQHLHGTVQLNLQVRADGGVSKADVATSSGNAGLDLVASLSVQAWRFAPGNGEQISVGLVFADDAGKTAEAGPQTLGLPEDAQAPVRLSPLPTGRELETALAGFDHGRSTYCDVLIGEDGLVHQVRAFDPRFDLDYSTILSLLFAERQTYRPAQRNGRPIAVRVLQKITWPPERGYIAEPPAIMPGGPPALAMLLARPASMTDAGTPDLKPFSYPGIEVIMRGGPRRDNVPTTDLLAGMGLPATEQPPPGWETMTQVDPAYRTGLEHLENGQHDAAIADFGTALSHTPNHPQYLADRAEAFARRGAPGDAGRALADHARIIALMPDDAYGYFARADSERLLKRLDAARRDLDAAIFMEPGNVSFLVARITLDRLQDNDAAARADTALADAIDPLFRQYLQTGDNVFHVWRAGLIAPDAPARLDPYTPRPVAPLALASRRHLSGHVALMVRVSRGGLPAQIKIAASSGEPLLDAAAILSASHWGYLPRTVKGEAQIDPILEDWVKVDIDYPADGPAQAVDWTAAAPTPPRLLAPPIGPEEMQARYPAIALMHNLPHAAETTLDVLVGADGTVQDMKVSRSSGFGMLDAMGMDLAQSWRFSPALRGGAAVTGHVLVPVLWTRRATPTDRDLFLTGSRF